MPRAKGKRVRFIHMGKRLEENNMPLAKAGIKSGHVILTLISEHLPQPSVSVHVPCVAVTTTTTVSVLNGLCAPRLAECRHRVSTTWRLAVKAMKLTDREASTDSWLQGLQLMTWLHCVPCLQPRLHKWTL